MCMWPQVNASSVGSNPEQDHVGAPAAHTDPVMVWRAELKHTVCFSWEKLIIFKWFCLVYSQTYSFSRCICFGSFLSVPASKSKSLVCAQWTFAFVCIHAGFLGLLHHPALT